jgi:hypothetical protein
VEVITESAGGIEKIAIFSRALDIGLILIGAAGGAKVS